MNASCEHFSEYFKDFGPTAFNIIHGIFSACVSQEARRQKVSLWGKFPTIYVCGTKQLIAGCERVSLEKTKWKLVMETAYTQFMLQLKRPKYLQQTAYVHFPNKIDTKFVFLAFVRAFEGHIMSVLHMRQLWTTALLLFTLYIFRMQRPAHSWPFRN